jgi:hypothetical protein
VYSFFLAVAGVPWVCVRRKKRYGDVAVVVRTGLGGLVFSCAAVKA